MLAQLGATAVHEYLNKYEAKCSLLIARHLAAILCIALTADISLINNLRFCSSAEAGLFLNFELK